MRFTSHLFISDWICREQIKMIWIVLKSFWGCSLKLIHNKSSREDWGNMGVCYKVFAPLLPGMRIQNLWPWGIVFHRYWVQHYSRKQNYTNSAKHYLLQDAETTRDSNHVHCIAFLPSPVVSKYWFSRDFLSWTHITHLKELPLSWYICLTRHTLVSYLIFIIPWYLANNNLHILLYN